MPALMQDAELRSILARLPNGIAGHIARIDARQGDLFPQEAESISQAIPKRRAAFTAGRTAARHAMATFGLPAQPILQAKDRRPIWPKDWLGTISHSDTIAAALVAPAHQFFGLGIDLERLRPLERNLIDRICRPEERLQPNFTDHTALQIFAIKESIYKSFNPREAVFLDFSDVCVSLSRDGNSFTAKLVNADIAQSHRFVETSGLCGTTCDHAYAITAPRLNIS